jgi:signal transduction histidine kinase
VNALEAFHQLCGALPESTLLLHADSTIAVANVATGELLGRPAADLIGCRLTELADDDEDHIRDLLRLWLRSRELLPGGLTFRRSDGRPIRCRVEGGLVLPSEQDTSALVLVRLFDRDRSPTMFRVLNDRIENLNAEVAARQRSEAIQKILVEDLRRANEDLNQFAFSASHDLREPLRMIAVYSQLLGRKLRTVLDEETSEYLRHTILGAHRMEALVRDLLAYTETATLDVTECPLLDASASLEEAISNLRLSIEESGADIVATHLPLVQTHKVHLSQLFQNLIGNAIKYRKAERPEIRIGAERDGMKWVFSISDNGIGVPPQYQTLIFGVFKRLHTHTHSSGTGIGLAICKKIVERYGGRIWVESEEGKGSTFRFTLPVSQTADCN